MARRGARAYWNTAAWELQEESQPQQGSQKAGPPALSTPVASRPLQGLRMPWSLPQQVSSPLAAPGDGQSLLLDSHPRQGLLPGWGSLHLRTTGVRSALLLGRVSRSRPRARSLPHRAGPLCGEATRHPAPPSLRRAWKWSLGRARSGWEQSKPRPGRQAGGAAPIPADMGVWPRQAVPPAWRQSWGLCPEPLTVAVESGTGGQPGAGTLHARQSSPLNMGWLSCAFSLPTPNCAQRG